MTEPLNFEGWVCPMPLRDHPNVIMGHGGGGKLSAELVEHLFLPAFKNETLAHLGDSAVLPVAGASDGLVFASLSSLAVVIGMVATMPAIPATLTSLAPDVSQITGWSDYAVTMTQVMGYSTVVLPYQVPPLIVGMAISGVPVRSAVRTILILAAVTVVLLWPLAFLWWHVLGVI